MRALWELINAGSLAKLKPLIEPYAGGLLWDPVMVSILAAPSWSLLGLLRHPASFCSAARRSR